jgi:hypothetical protein
MQFLVDTSVWSLAFRKKTKTAINDLYSGNASVTGQEFLIFGLEFFQNLTYIHERGL